MKGQIARGAVILLLAGLTGCVSQSTHEQALRELQSAKNDLDRVRVQNDAFNKQILGLRESQAKLKDEVEKTHAQIAFLKDEIAKERQAGEAKVKDLDRQVKELTAAKKTLTQERDVAMQRYEDALKVQRRQAKELKERANASLIQPPIQPTPPAEPAPEAPPSDQQANASSPTTAQSPSPSLVDINKATPNDLSMILGLAKEDADKLIKSRPYKTKEELVTKAGIAKATLDRIQDKISVGP
jgi:DNA uptake protein ComE-like DNA-binding protein